MSSVACASCQWSRASAFARHRAQWYQSGEHWAYSQIKACAKARSIQGNILITEEGVACLQIGIYWTIRSHADDAVGQSSTEPWLRYLAPELLDPSEAALMGRTPPKESDVYSLAMTAYEVQSSRTAHGRP